MDNDISRRTFAQIVGVGALSAAMPRDARQLQRERRSRITLP